MKVKLRDKSLLGNNINSFIRKASNPEYLRPMLGRTIGRQREPSSLTLSPERKNTSKQLKLKINSIQKETRQGLYDKLYRMLEASKTPLTSRLLAEEEKDVKQLSERQKVDRENHLENGLEVYGRAKFRRMNWKREKRNSELDRNHQQKIREMFEGPSRKESSLGLNDSAKNNSFLYTRHFKPWETIRVNGVPVELQDKKEKKLRSTGSVFYKTMYG